MTLKMICLFSALGCFITLSAQAIQKGTWLTNKGNTKVETYQKDGAWYGKVLSSDNPKAKIGRDSSRAFKQVDGQRKGKLFVARKNREVDAVIESMEDKLDLHHLNS